MQQKDKNSLAPGPYLKMFYDKNGDYGNCKPGELVIMIDHQTAFLFVNTNTLKRENSGLLGLST